MKGLYVPLVTPYYKGSFDRQSLRKLVHFLEPFVDGFVPCLSSGEGDRLDDKTWTEVVRTVIISTTKPVYAGIKRQERQRVIQLLRKANSMGCEGVVLPTPALPKAKIFPYFQEISDLSTKPIIIYNTEENPLTEVKIIQQIDQLPRIVAIKDSSKNIAFFRKLISFKKRRELRLDVLQGMENLLFESKGCDGYLISLLNVEPELCKQMFSKQKKDIDQKIKSIFWEYNLGGRWYITLKALLYQRGIIRSAEEVPTGGHYERIY